ncbi:MAG: glycoside hydrolase family 78 protein [Candidatus Aminicenantes bacterium]|nr:glycoside hydrolase family 78 protein [Candidatus Aminicenantes bacterium]
MKKWIAAVVLAVLVLVTACSQEDRGKISDLKITQLRCEYLKNPLGIDVVKPRLSWVLESSERGQKQTAYRIIVSTSEENLSKDIGDLWDSGKMKSERTNQIVYEGKNLQSREKCCWKVFVWDKDRVRHEPQETAFWSMGLLNEEDWEASWIGMELAPHFLTPEKLAPGPPPPWFRKTFALGKPVKKAMVYITAQGIFRLHINGQQIGKDVFAPEWTDYNKRIQYRTYDVTENIKPGKNAIGAVVGDGWYSGYLGWRKFRGNYGLQNSLLLQLEVEYEDGTIEVLATDKTWGCSDGPIISSDLLMGEHYDARKEMPGWDTAGFDDNDWKPAVLMEKPQARLISQPSEPVQVTQHIEPVNMSEPKKGVYVFDLGQNIAGWARLRVKGKSGTKVMLRHAERLNPDGTVYTTNLRDAKATDTYILKGGAEEVFEPRFTFHGFQYVEVTGFPGVPGKDAITGCAIHSAAPPAGSFECSSPLVNKIYQNLTWSQRGNYISVPTDCPQRDERLGWMGDAQIFIRTGTFNMDAAAFFTKWMVDVEDAQSGEGAFPDFAPRLKDKVLMRFESAPAWGDAGIIVPWTVYRVHGDTRIVSGHWEAMVKWMDFLQEANPELIRKNKVGNNYGDWLSIKADTPKDLLATAYWAYDARLMSRMAEAIGRSSEAFYYEKLFQNIREAFQREFVLPDGRIKGETQTGYLLALAMDLVPEELRSRSAEHLVENIKQRDWHLSTGFVGAGYLNPVLTEMGYPDVAYRLLLNETFPSWGYSINQGATTIWERWDGWTEEKGFQDPGMNSFNHYAFGSVGEWLFRFVAGIDLDPEIPGYKRIIIRPHPGGGLEYARAEYDSIQGKISSGWKLEDGKLILNVTIPANTTAMIHVPAEDLSQVTESGKPAEDSTGVKFLRLEKGRAVFEVVSGTYTFSTSPFL